MNQGLKNGIFSETERNGKYLRRFEKRNVTKFKESKLKRKNNSVSEKEVTKNVEKNFLPAAQYSFLRI
jgi:hypothetical protein